MMHAGQSSQDSGCFATEECVGQDSSYHLITRHFKGLSFFYFDFWSYLDFTIAIQLALCCSPTTTIAATIN